MCRPKISLGDLQGRCNGGILVESGTLENRHNYNALAHWKKKKKIDEIQVPPYWSGVSVLTPVWKVRNLFRPLQHSYFAG